MNDWLLIFYRPKEHKKLNFLTLNIIACPHCTHYTAFYKAVAQPSFLCLGKGTKSACLQNNFTVTTCISQYFCNVSKTGVGEWATRIQNNMTLCLTTERSGRVVNTPASY
jgi:hypothetical protein